MTKLYDLKVHSVSNPFGLDSAPRFSWKMSSDKVGEKQTAYEITVSEITGGAKKPVWTSGKVNGSKHSGIVCDAELKPATSYEWSVIAYCKDGSATEPAVSGFVTGLMESGWGGADWITVSSPYDGLVNVKNYTVEIPFRFDGSIIFLIATGSHRRYYRFDIGVYEESGFLMIPQYFDCDLDSSKDYHRCKTGRADLGSILGIAPEKASGGKYTATFKVTPEKIDTYINGTYISTVEITEGMPEPICGVPGVHSGGRPIMWLSKLKMTDDDTGKVLYSCDYAKDDIFPCGSVENGELRLKWAGRNFPNADSFAARKEFSCKKKPVGAKLFVSGLGVFTPYINGKLVENTVNGESFSYQLMPGSTEPRVRRHYYTYDLGADVLNEGDNTISAIVTSGWWSDMVCTCHGIKNGFLAKLIISYDDGSEETVVTDESWKVDVKNCPNGYTSIFSGEIYDARIGLAFTENGYNDSEWENAVINKEFIGDITTGFKGAIYERTDLEHSATDLVVYKEVVGATEEEYGTIKVDRHIELSDENSEFVLHAGETAVVDFGANMAGREKFTVVAKEGTRITFCHGEALNDKNGAKSRFCSGPEGSVWRTNLIPLSLAITQYTCREGEQTFTPRHTYYGYRYGEITVSDTVVFKKVTFQVLTSVLHDSGKLKTSNELLNKFCDNVHNSLLSNYLSVPTDCPQRAERVGWSGDAQAFAQTAIYYTVDTRPFLSKWLTDMRDCQADNGEYMCGAPRGVCGGARGAFAWTDAGVLVPYYIYKAFGDDEIIYENYEAMQKYVDIFLASTEKAGAKCNYGDWLSPQGSDKESRLQLAVEYYAWVARCMSELASAIGKTEDAKRYNEVYETEKAFFKETYINENGDLKYMTYTCVLFALHVNLIDDEETIERYIKFLRETVENDEYKVQTGFLGTAIVLPMLSRLGLTDIAYRMMLCTKMPSWLFPVVSGATSIWEKWHAHTEEAGFNHARISFNHYAFGAAAEWIYAYAAGIRPEKTYDEFIIAPEPSSLIESVSAEYESESGRIVSAWRYDDGKLIFNIEVPANTSAKVILPVSRDKIVSIDGEGITLVNESADNTEFSAVCGKFTVITKA